jgi:hypothetical protein
MHIYIATIFLFCFQVFRVVDQTVCLADGSVVLTGAESPACSKQASKLPVLTDSSVTVTVTRLPVIRGIPDFCRISKLRTRGLAGHRPIPSCCTAAAARHAMAWLKPKNCARVCVRMRGCLLWTHRSCR